jgi:hypothetical protein
MNVEEERANEKRQSELNKTVAVVATALRAVFLGVKDNVEKAASSRRTPKRFPPRRAARNSDLRLLISEPHPFYQQAELLGAATQKVKSRG